MSGSRTITFPSADGLVLHGRIWERANPSAIVVVSHGYGEHGGAYGHVAEAIGRDSGAAILTFDYRGHGLSPGKRGVVRSYDDLVGDLRGALTWASGHHPEAPRIVLGHSNGGLVALCLLADGGPCDGLILSNPALKLAAPVPPWKIGVGKVLRKLAPTMTLNASVRGDWLTGDPAMQAVRRADTLRHDRISGPLFFGMVARGEAIVDRAEAIVVPLLMLLGSDDQLIDPATSAAFFDRLPGGDKTLRHYDGGRHELFNDLERDRVIAEVASWLSHRFGPIPVGREATGS